MAKKDEPAAQEQPKLRVLSQYIRDMSFENIAAQQNRSDEVKPEITVQVNLDANKKGENSYEVILKVTINAKAKDESVFILEVDYAGRFHVEHVPEDQLHPFLMIECPRMLFPYLRRVVGDITRDGGYPPLFPEVCVEATFSSVVWAVLKTRSGWRPPKSSR